MAQEGWGLNSWFAEGREKVLQSGRVSLVEAGYIHQLKWELQQRLSGKGTSAVKVKGLEAHLEAQFVMEEKALKVLQDEGISRENAEMYFKYFSQPQRARDEKGWQKVEKKWNALNTRQEQRGEEWVDDTTRMIVSALVDSYNKATKFIVQAHAKLETQQPSKDTRSLDWVSDMITKCDEMIALIETADPSFKKNKLRNN